MDNPVEFLPKPHKLYPISWFREAFSLFSTMLCRLHGSPNCIVFKEEWAPLAHHILTTGESFNWAKILLVVLKESIEKYQKTLVSIKPTFYLSSYVMDIFCASFPLSTMGWNWTRVGTLVHIYCSTLWEENSPPLYMISVTIL